MGLTEEQKKMIDERLRKEGLNDFGDKKGTVYAGGTPLFDMLSGKVIDRYEHILRRHPGWLPQKEK